MWHMLATVGQHQAFLQVQARLRYIKNGALQILSPIQSKSHVQYVQSNISKKIEVSTQARSQEHLIQLVSMYNK